MKYLNITDNSTDIELRHEIYRISRPYFKCIEGYEELNKERGFD